MADITVRVGDVPPPLTVVMTDGNGNPVAVPSNATVMFTLTSPAGTLAISAPATVANQTTNPGQVSYTWQATDSAVAGGYVGRFVLTNGPQVVTFPTAGGITVEFLADTVAPPVSLDEVKAHLNYRGTDDADDVEISGFILAAVDIIEGFVGPILQKTITAEQHDGGGYVIVLRHRPVISVTSVDEFQSNVDYLISGVATPQTSSVYSFTFEPTMGTVTRRGTGGYPIPFREGPGSVFVTYVAGRTSLPWKLRLAILELVAHLWQHSQQGAGVGGSPGVAGSFDAPSNVAGDNSGVPMRVLELLGDSRRVPGIA